MEENILHIKDFNGPLDYLLKEIKDKKIDIYDIPIIEVTNQYLDFIYKADDFDMEEASEFIVMASTLLEIKSKMLLPPEVDDDGEIIDPRENLVTQLLEYKAIKEISQMIKEKEKDYVMSIPKDPEYYSEIKDKYIINDIDVDLLAKALRNVLVRHKIKIEEENEKHTIVKDNYSMTESINTIKNLLKTSNKISFFSLFETNTEKGYIVATFLATLELLKMNLVKLIQEENYSDIILEKI